MLEVEDIAALEPDVGADRRGHGGERIAIRRTGADRVRLADGSDADRLNDEITELLALVRWPQEVNVGWVEGDEDMQVAVGFGPDRCDPARDL